MMTPARAGPTARARFIGRIERDSIREVFIADHFGYESLLRGGIEGVYYAEAEREDVDHPDMDVVRYNERSEDERKDSGEGLSENTGSSAY